MERRDLSRTFGDRVVHALLLEARTQKSLGRNVRQTCTGARSTTQVGGGAEEIEKDVKHGDRTISRYCI